MEMNVPLYVPPNADQVSCNVGVEKTRMDANRKVIAFPFMTVLPVLGTITETNVQHGVLSIVLRMKFSALEKSIQVVVKCQTFVWQRNVSKIF